MILANSFGKNKGKKYCNYKGKRKNPLTNEDYAKLSDFNVWFAEGGYDNIKKQLIAKQVFDEDVFNETYIKICDSLVYANLHIMNYGSYFMRAYATNLTLSFVKESKYRNQDVLENVMCEDDSNIVTETKLNDEERLSEIITYVRNNYERIEFRAFILITIRGYSYKLAANKLGVQKYLIDRSMPKIKKELKENLTVITATV